MSADDQLQKVRAIIKTRGDNYGSVADNWETTADLWNAVLRRKLKVELSAADIGLLMIQLKVARLINSPDHDDSQLDVRGYAALLNEVV